MSTDLNPRQSWTVIEGDCRDVLATLEAGSVQTCVTSPPYFGLRDYGHDGTSWPSVEYATLGGTVAVPPMVCALGLEPTPAAFIGHLVLIFREVRRVLVDDGTAWLNLGDSYNNRSVARPSSHQGGLGFTNVSIERSWAEQTQHGLSRLSLTDDGLKEKDLLGIPWMAAFALRADGWYLRSDIVWAKTVCMPEPVKDRPTRSHEFLFLLGKSKGYFYDHEAVQEDAVSDRPSGNGYKRAESLSRDGRGQPHPWQPTEKRNRRDVWTVNSQPFPGAHFATFPPKLIEPCILAGSRPGDVVLDPFAGAGTTGMVALRHGRSFLGVELNPEYVRLARDRIIADAPLLNTHSEVAA